MPFHTISETIVLRSLAKYWEIIENSCPNGHDILKRAIFYDTGQ